MPTRTAVLNSLANSLFGTLQRSFEKPDVAVAERRGAKLGMLWYRLDRKHRERTYSNLRMCFPEWSEAKVDEVARGVFRHFGIVAADFLRSPIRTDQEVLATTEVVGMEHLEEAERRGNGAIAVTAHFGNWERFGHCCVAMGRPIAVVARDADNGELQDRVQKIREGTGIKVLSRGNSARAMLSSLRRGELVGILPDQNSSESFVPFFGKPCGSVLGPAVLHQRTGAALLPAYCARVGVGRYKIILKPLVDPDNEAKDVVAVTAQLNAVLESVIREYPDQWLWVHDRWKSARRRGML